MPAISVIVPVYNPGPYLIHCLDSICSQTLADLEVICVNDCSTDNSLSVLNEYSLRDPRVTVIDSKINQGAATSRNMAVKSAKGEFLAFVDSDDSFDRDFLERLYLRARETGADIVKGERRMYDPSDGSFYPDNKYMGEMHSKVKRNKACFVNAFSSAIYKTELIRKHGVHFLDGLVFFEDAYFTIMATLFNEKTEVVDGTFYNYTMNRASVCSKGIPLRYVKNRVQGSSAVMDLLDEYPVDKEHYLTVCDYLLMEFLVVCRNINLSDVITMEGAKGAAMIFKRCRYPEELLYRHFMEFKTLNRKNLFAQLRKRLDNHGQNI